MIGEEYLLGVGTAGKKRMEILNRLYNPSTQEFLRRSGLQKGMRVLEVGCGIGEMTAWLAGQVGSSGLVVSIDSSPQQLKLAGRKVSGLKHDNVEWREASVYDVQDWDERFDFVVCRWVLLHLRRPQVAVAALVGSLDRGGVLALEDCVTDSAFCYPSSGAFRRFIAGWLDVSDAQGLNPRIGERLSRLLVNAGCRLEQYGLYQPLLVTPDDRRLFSMSLAETRQAHIETGAMSKEAVAKVVAALEREAAESRAMGFVLNYQAAGKRA